MKISESSYLFQVGCYNDIDHLSPVIWKFSKEGKRCLLMISRLYDWTNDYRIHFLKGLPHVEICDFAGIDMSGVMGKVYRRLRFGSGFARRFFEQNNIRACVSEWYRPSRDFFGRLRETAREMSIPCFGLPHGCSIHLNYNTMNPAAVDKYRQIGRWADITAMNVCDVFVVDSVNNRKMNVDGGVQEDKCQVWGSARFSPDWSALNMDICPPFTPRKNDLDKLKVIFFLPHWRNNVDREATVELIKQIAHLPGVYIAVKEHTRGNGEFPDDRRALFESFDNVELAVPGDSPALIKWADVVVNFGSSIGIDAVIHHKPLIYPRYLHGNTTIYDEDDACFKCLSPGEVIDVINAVKKHTTIPGAPTESMRSDFLKKVVYGGNEPFDILGYYLARISGSKLDAFADIKT